MANGEASDGFAQWAILELMGHRKLGGMVTETTLAGGAFLRIDIYPGELTEPVATQYYAPGSVYCLTPTTENVARDYARNSIPRPVSVWELPERASGGSGPDLYFDENDR